MTFEERFKTIYNDLAKTEIHQLASVYHEDIEFVDPITAHHGLGNVEKYFARLLESTSGCEFDIHAMQDCSTSPGPYDYLVEWTMRLSLKNKTKIVTVDGVSVLKLKDDKIIYHRDYYDIGEMVYEHVPILARVIHFIKKKLAS